MEPAALAAERERAVAEARARLAGYPTARRCPFETLLKAAQVAAVVHEDTISGLTSACSITSGGSSWNLEGVWHKPGVGCGERCVLSDAG